MELSELARPFKADEIEWRVAQSGVKDGKPWAQVLAYVTSRAIFDRLDDVCGADSWCNEYREWQGNEAVLCGISIRIGEQWVTKWDGAENTKVEEIKGGFSSAMKRAGVPWGIGRYLYGIGSSWAVIAENGAHRGVAKGKNGEKDTYFKWDAPNLPAWALPQGTEPPKDNKPASMKTIIANDLTDAPPAERQRLQIVADKLSVLFDVEDYESAIALVKASTEGDPTQVNILRGLGEKAHWKALGVYRTKKAQQTAIDKMKKEAA